MNSTSGHIRISTLSALLTAFENVDTAWTAEQLVASVTADTGCRVTVAEISDVLNAWQAAGLVICPADQFAEVGNRAPAKFALARRRAGCPNQRVQPLTTKELD